MVKCKDCGLLTTLVPEREGYPEVPPNYREKGERIAFLQNAHGGPVCLVMAANLGREFRDAADNGGDSARQTRVVTCKERECDSFMEWRRGFTPKEHAEMQHLEIIRRQGEDRKRDDEERAERRRLADEKYRDEQRQLDLDRQERQRKDEADRRAEEKERQAKQRREDQERQDRRDAVEWQRKKHLAYIVAAIGVITGVLGFGAKWAIDRVAPLAKPTAIAPPVE